MRAGWSGLCPLLAHSGLFERARRASAFGGEADTSAFISTRLSAVCARCVSLGQPHGLPARRETSDGFCRRAVAGVMSKDHRQHSGRFGPLLRRAVFSARRFSIGQNHFGVWFLAKHGEISVRDAFRQASPRIHNYFLSPRFRDHDFAVLTAGARSRLLCSVTGVRFPAL